MGRAEAQVGDAVRHERAPAQLGLVHLVDQVAVPLSDDLALHFEARGQLAGFLREVAVEDAKVLDALV